MKPSYRRLCSAMLALLFTCLWPYVTQAQESAAAFGLRPVQFNPDNPATQSYFIYDATPGQTISDQVRVTNIGSAAGTVRLYAVDATTGQTSGAVYLSADAPKLTVGNWVALEAPEVTLQPGEERVVAFKLRIPANAKAGQYLGALVAENTQLQQQQKTDSALNISLQTRTVTAIQINLPGPPVEKLSVTGITSVIEQGFQMLQIGLRNDGNQMIRPVGTLIVRDSTGQIVQRIPLKLDTLLPGTEIQYPVAMEGQALVAGSYETSVEFQVGQQPGATSAKLPFTVEEAQIEQLYAAREQLLPDAPKSSSVGQQNVLLMSLVAIMMVLLLSFYLYKRHKLQSR